MERHAALELALTRWRLLPPRLLAALALLLGACAAAPAQPIELRDDRGAAVTFGAPPARIVSLLPSLTEAVAALGAGQRLVGVDRYSNWPPALLERLPRLGGLDDAHLEAIVALRPDVVLASTSARVLDRLEGLGVVVLRLRSDSHEDVQRSLLTLSRLLTRSPTAGEQLWAAQAAAIEAAAARVPPVVRGRSVYFELAGGPYAAGTASFIGQTLARLALHNIVPSALGPFPKLNPEFVVRANPDIVMGEAREQRRLASRAGFGSMAAIQRQRTCGFDSAQYELLTRPGPRLGEAAAVLAACLERLQASFAAGPAPAPTAVAR